MICEPDDLPVSEVSISNYNHIVDGSAEDILRQGYAIEHSAWDHWGLIWFQDGKFYERVMIYCRHVATVSADNLSDLLSEVNDRYGHG